MERGIITIGGRALNKAAVHGDHPREPDAAIELVNQLTRTRSGQR